MLQFGLTPVYDVTEVREKVSSSDALLQQCLVYNQHAVIVTGAPVPNLNHHKKIENLQSSCNLEKFCLSVCVSVHGVITGVTHNAEERVPPPEFVHEQYTVYRILLFKVAPHSCDVIKVF